MTGPDELLHDREMIYQKSHWAVLHALRQSRHTQCPRSRVEEAMGRVGSRMRNQGQNSYRGSGTDVALFFSSAKEHKCLAEEQEPYRGVLIEEWPRACA